LLGLVAVNVAVNPLSLRPSGNEPNSPPSPKTIGNEFIPAEQSGGDAAPRQVQPS
jgi:hypothetical protein